MSIQFACPKCGKSYNVDDRLAGKSANCKKCGERMRVPAASAASDEPDLSALLPTEGAINEEAAPMREESAAPPARAARAKPATKDAEGGRSASISPVMLRRIIMAVVAVGLLVTLFILRPWEWEKRPEGPDPGHYSAEGNNTESRLCNDNFVKINKVLVAYADKNADKLPPDFKTLLTVSSSLGTPLTPTDFVCPTSGKKPPSNQSAEAAIDWITKNSDYAYVGGLSRGATPPKIVVYEKWHREENEVLHVINTSLAVTQESMPSFKQTLSIQQSGK